MLVFSYFVYSPSSCLFAYRYKCQGSVQADLHKATRRKSNLMRSSHRVSIKYNLSGYIHVYFYLIFILFIFVCSYFMWLRQNERLNRNRAKIFVRPKIESKKIFTLRWIQIGANRRLLRKSSWTEFFFFITDVIRLSRSNVNCDSALVSRVGSSRMKMKTRGG